MNIRHCLYVAALLVVWPGNWKNSEAQNYSLAEYPLKGGLYGTNLVWGTDCLIGFLDMKVMEKNVTVSDLYQAADFKAPGFEELVAALATRPSMNRYLQAFNVTAADVVAGIAPLYLLSYRTTCTFNPPDSMLSCKGISVTGDPEDESAWTWSVAKVVSEVDGRVTEIWGAGSGEAEARADLLRELGAPDSKISITYRCPFPISLESTPDLGIELPAKWQRDTEDARQESFSPNDIPIEVPARIDLSTVSFYQFEGKWDDAEKDDLTPKAIKMLDLLRAQQKILWASSPASGN